MSLNYPPLPSWEKLNSLIWWWLSKRSIKLLLIESISFFIFFFFTSFCRSSSKTIYLKPLTMSQHCDLIVAKLKEMFEFIGWLLLVMRESLTLQNEFVSAFVCDDRFSSLRLLTVQLFFLWASIVCNLVDFFKLTLYFAFEQLKLVFPLDSSFAFSTILSTNLMRLLVNSLLPYPIWLFLRKS